METLMGLLGGGWTSTALIAIAVAAGLLIASRVPRLRQIIVFVINFIPAIVLWVLGVIAIPLWGLMDRLVRLLLARSSVDAMFGRWIAWLSQIGLQTPRVGRRSAAPSIPGAQLTSTVVSPNEPTQSHDAAADEALAAAA